MLIANKMFAPQDIDNLIIYANAMAMVVLCAKEIKGKVYTETHDKDGNFNGYAQNPHIKLFKEMSEIVTMEARKQFLNDILDIQSQVNMSAHLLNRPEIDILNQEEVDRINELITLNTWPNGWDGTEINGSVLQPH